MSQISINVKVVNRKLIKPWIPTPPNLRTYNISLIDQLNAPMHIMRILYYPPPPSDDHASTVNLKIMEKSLSQVLTIFYPLAGRYIKDKHSVDCNDEGVLYVESQVDSHILKIIHSGKKSSELDLLDKLLPLGVGEVDEPTDPILGVQVNKFECGGIAIGVCASHRIFDTCSLGIFLTAWANANANANAAAAGGGGGDELFVHVNQPDFNLASFFPPENVEPICFGVSRNRDNSIVGKRFMFDKNAISKLRDLASPEWRISNINISTSNEEYPQPRPPSRMVVVSSIITQALVRADKVKEGNGKSSRPALITQAINARERTVPPVSKHACGTWVSFAYLEFTSDEINNTIEYGDMVSKMSEIIMEGVRNCEKILCDKEFGRYVMIDSYYEVAKKESSNDYKVIWITDWSKFGEYQLDFGWGSKPIWVSLANAPLQDLVILMNTKENDGIEAWVYLHESNMLYFEKDEDIIRFTTN